MKNIQDQKTQTKKPNRSSLKMTCVRFSEKEYLQISKDAAKEKKTIPQLLKSRYNDFDKEPMKIPINELRELKKQIIRVGNNVNTALRKINSGEFHMLNDIKDSFEMSSTEISILTKRIIKIL